MRLTSLLFVPGNRQNMIDKALTFQPDAFIPDMEDSIPDGEKDQARQLIEDNLPRLHASGTHIIPRVNALETGLAEADIAAVVGPHIHGISIGKVYTPEDIKKICALLAQYEQHSGVEVGSIKLVPWIETASAIVHCYAICKASPRIVAVAFGAEDLAHDMGLERLEDQSDVNYARNAMAIGAHAARVQVLDVPFFGFKDQEALTREALASKRIGFTGKFAIHPAQIDPINQAFRPSEEQIAKARRIVEAYETAEREGRGSTSLDGQVVDVPVVKRAYALLRKLGELPE